MTNKIFCIAYLGLIFQISCTSALKPEEGDGPPLHYMDLSKITNPIPKDEPKSRYGNPETYQVFGKQYAVLKNSLEYNEVGVASWYGRKFHGRRTSSGEPYDVYQMTAAHKHLPLPTYAHVENLENGKSIIVKINDRGPFVDNRILDLSYVAAMKLGVTEKGTAKIKLTAIDPIKYPSSSPKSDKNLPPVINPIASSNLPAESHAGYYLQLGAFKEKANASQLASAASYLATNRTFINVHIKETHDRKLLHAVRIGPFSSEHEARQAKEKLAQTTHIIPHITKEIVD